MSLQLLSACILLGLLLVAVTSDLSTRRIPNALVAYGAALGLALQSLAPAGLFPGSEAGLTTGLLGGLTGLVLFLPFHALRTMGAGDVKLLAMAGTWLGAASVAHAALWTLLAGGLLALTAALAGGHLRQVGRNLRALLTWSITGALARQGAALPAPPQTTGRLPYALAIATGCGVEMARRWSTA